MWNTRQPTLAETWTGRADPGFGQLDANAKVLGSPYQFGGQGRGGPRKIEKNVPSGSSGRGRGGKKRGGRGRGRGRGNSTIRVPDSVIYLEEEDDELFHQAMGQFELADSEVAKALEAGAAATEIPGFDETAGETWIYPTNRSFRDYQFSITQTALFHNTLVSLPTGLGKTFIAAVVMYNYYRWYPNGIIVFMAPTRPLVTQQLDACHNIVGINPAVTVELTGQILPAKRETLWKEKRVFFLTPQVMQSDITRNFCIAEKVRCIVIDEAHKAVGNHSYAQVLSSIIKKNNHFRVLALSATPGNEVDAIQQVFRNLLISRVELRSDKSPDVLPYVHEREVETRVVSMDPFLQSIHEQIKDIFQVYTGKLMQQNILPRNGSSFGAYQLVQSRQRYRTSPPPRIGQFERGLVEVAFSTCISLAKAIELLNIHGLRSFYSFLQGLLLREKGSAVVASELRKKGVEPILRCVQERLNISVENSSFNISTSGLFDSFNESGNPSIPQLASSNIEDYLQSHPKMKILREIVEKHFEAYAVQNISTRIMIFSQYRDSVQEIGNMLSLLNSRVKPMVFMGQAKVAGAGGRGLKQKEQMQVVEKFKEGGFNVLVATSVGEEGLDIGDVDLIICFDSNKSATRNIQRMGRTGRQRQGRIIFLLTEGREERLYRSSLTQQSSIQRSIMDPEKLNPYLYPVSPRMVPEGVEPQCFKMSIILSSEHDNYTNQRKTKESKVDEVTLDESLNVKISTSSNMVTMEEVSLDPVLGRGTYCIESFQQDPDDSDFIRPGNPPEKKKKAQKGLLKKTKSGNKKTGGSTKNPVSEVNTIAKCIELMESKRSTASKPDLPAETIVIDDEVPYFTPPITDFDHHTVATVDDYDLLCSIFDIRETNAHSVAPPCVYIPLQEKEVIWKPEYNSIPLEDILLTDSQLRTVKELVDSSVYAGSIDRYCKCGNKGSTDISLVESSYFGNEFENEFEHSFGNQAEVQSFTKSPARKSLYAVQPVASPSIRKSLYPSPSTDNRIGTCNLKLMNTSTAASDQGSGDFSADNSKNFKKYLSIKCNSMLKFDGGASPFANSEFQSSLPAMKTSTPIRSHEDALKNRSKYFTQDPHVNRKSINEFDAGFIFDDESDPIFNDSWLGEMETCTSNNSASTERVVNNQSVNTTDVNTYNVNTLSRDCVSQVNNCSDSTKAADDSSTASESDFRTSSTPSRLSVYISGKSPHVAGVSASQGVDYNSKRRARPEFNDLLPKQPDSSTVAISAGSGQLQTSAKAPNQIELEIPKPAQNSNSNKPSSPDLGLRRRKFTFKKKTSVGSVSFDLSPLTKDTEEGTIEETSSCPQEYSHTHGISRSAYPAARAASQAKTEKSPEKLFKPRNGPKKYNPREMFSRLLDDSEIDFIPGTSSEEEDMPKNDDKCAEDQHQDSDSTDWDPDELPATPPDSYTGRSSLKGNTEREKARINKRDTDFVFSPDRRNFPLMSQCRSTISRKLGAPVKPVTYTAPEFMVSVTGSSTKRTGHPSSPKCRPFVSHTAVSNPSKKELTFQPYATWRDESPAAKPVKKPSTELMASVVSSSAKCTSPARSLKCRPFASQTTDSKTCKKDSTFQPYTTSRGNAATEDVEFLCSVQKPVSKADLINSMDDFQTRKPSKQTTPPAKKFKFTWKPTRTVDALADSSGLDKSDSPPHQSFPCATERHQRHSPPSFSSPAREALSGSLHVFPTPARASDSSSRPVFSSPARASSGSPHVFRTPVSSSLHAVSSPDSDDVVFRRRGPVKRIVDSDERPPISKLQARKIPAKKTRRNPFLLDEAVGTSEDSSVEDFDERNYVDDSFVMNGDDEDDDLVSATQQQAMYLQSVKDIIPVRTGRVEEPLIPLEPYDDDMMPYLNDSFCDDDVEYADVGVYTQCMIAAREEIEKEKSSGKATRRLRSRR